MTQTAQNIPPRGNVTNGVDRILSMPRASVYRTGAASIGPTAGTPMSWDAMQYDNEGMWDTATALYPKTDGLYLFASWFGFQNVAGGYRSLSFTKTSAGVTTFNIGLQTESSPTAGSYAELSTSAMIEARAGDFVQVYVASSLAVPIDNGWTPTSFVNGFQACLISTL